MLKGSKITSSLLGFIAVALFVTAQLIFMDDIRGFIWGVDRLNPNCVSENVQCNDMAGHNVYAIVMDDITGSRLEQMGGTGQWYHYTESLLPILHEAANTLWKFRQPEYVNKFKQNPLLIVFQNEEAVSNMGPFGRYITTLVLTGGFHSQIILGYASGGVEASGESSVYWLKGRRRRRLGRKRNITGTLGLDSNSTGSQSEHRKSKESRSTRRHGITLREVKLRGFVRQFGIDLATQKEEDLFVRDAAHVTLLTHWLRADIHGLEHSCDEKHAGIEKSDGTVVHEGPHGDVSQVPDLSPDVANSTRHTWFRWLQRAIHTGNGGVGRGSGGDSESESEREQEQERLQQKTESVDIGGPNLRPHGGAAFRSQPENLCVQSILIDSSTSVTRQVAPVLASLTASSTAAAAYSKSITGQIARVIDTVVHGGIERDAAAVGVHWKPFRTKDWLNSRENVTLLHRAMGNVCKSLSMSSNTAMHSHENRAAALQKVSLLNRHIGDPDEQDDLFRAVPKRWSYDPKHPMFDKYGNKIMELVNFRPARAVPDEYKKVLIYQRDSYRKLRDEDEVRTLLLRHLNSDYGERDHALNGTTPGGSGRHLRQVGDEANRGSRAFLSPHSRKSNSNDAAAKALPMLEEDLWSVETMVHDNNRPPCQLMASITTTTVLLTPHGFQSLLVLFQPWNSALVEIFPRWFYKPYVYGGIQAGFREHMNTSRSYFCEESEYTRYFAIPLMEKWFHYGNSDCASNTVCRYFSKSQDASISHELIGRISKYLKSHFV